MFQVEANREKNYLLIILEGFIKGEEMEQVIANVHQKTRTLTKGFTIINDISGLKVLKPEDTEKVKSAQQWLYQQGAQKTIRVVGKSAFSRAQFQKTQQQGGALYTTIEVADMESAYPHL